MADRGPEARGNSLADQTLPEVVSGLRGHTPARASSRQPEGTRGDRASRFPSSRAPAPCLPTSSRSLTRTQVGCVTVLSGEGEGWVPNTAKGPGVGGGGPGSPGRGTPAQGPPSQTQRLPLPRSVAITSCVSSSPTPALATSASAAAAAAASSPGARIPGVRAPLPLMCPPARAQSRGPAPSPAPRLRRQGRGYVSRMRPLPRRSLAQRGCGPEMLLRVRCSAR